MATAPNTGMDKAEMKKLLTRSKEEPVNCAIGIGKDQQAMFMLHKTKPPMAILKDLEKLAGGPLRNPCHGSALVDADRDPKLVILTVNKASGGLAARLKKTLKGTGFTKAMIRLEDGTIAEMAEEDGDDAEGEAPPPAADVGALKQTLAGLVGRIAEAAGSDTALKAKLAKMAGDAATAIRANDQAGADATIASLREAIEAGPQGNGAAPAADTLRKDLAALIGRVGAVTDPAAKAKLAKLAGDANARIKANDAAGAAASIQQLRDGLDGGGGAAPEVMPLEIWRDAKDLAGVEIGKLQEALRAKKLPLFHKIADQGLNGITGRLQVGLQVALMDLNGKSGDALTAAKDKARKAVTDFRGFLGSDPTLPLLESNPLGVTITLRSSLPRALDAIENSLAA